MKSVYGFLVLIFFFVALDAQDNLSVKNNRVALVIGNATYLTGPLNNTVNDADERIEVGPEGPFTDVIEGAILRTITVVVSISVRDPSLTSSLTVPV